MKINFLILGVMSMLMAGCTLSVNDKNPKPVSILGQGQTPGASITNGSLTLTGSNLESITGLALTQSGGPNVQLTEFTTKTKTLLTVTLPSALSLPGMLLVSSSAAAEQVELSSLDALSVDGSLTVKGNTTLLGSTDVGFVKKENTCVGACVATCDPGTHVVSGGCSVSSSTIGLTANYPLTDTQWLCRAAGSVSVNAYVICGRTTLTY